MAEVKTKMQEREEYVIAVLKEAKGELVDSLNLRESLQMNTSNFYTLMMNLKRKYPSAIKSVHGGRSLRGGYRWAGKIPEEKEVAKKMDVPTIPETKEPVRYDDKHNDEGYADPTAYLAMRGMDSERKRGDIYEYRNSDGTLCDVLILSIRGNYFTCLPVYWAEHEFDSSEAQYMITVKDDDKIIFVNPGRIQTKPVKYITKLMRIPKEETFKKIVDSVGLYLGTSTEVTVPGPKEIVTKTVEVPVGITEEECLRRIEEAVEGWKEKYENQAIASTILSGDGTREPGISEEECLRRIEEAVEASEKEVESRYEFQLAMAFTKAEIYHDVLYKLLNRGA